MLNSSNIKPDKWYEEYYRILGRPSDEIEEQIKIAKEDDKAIDKKEKHCFNEARLRNDYWNIRGHSEVIADDIFNKDIVELQKEIIEYVKKEIKSIHKSKFKEINEIIIH